MLEIIIHYENSSYNHNELSLHTNVQRLIIPNVGEDMKELKPSYIVDGNVKQCNHIRTQFGSFFINIHLLYIRAM